MKYHNTLKNYKPLIPPPLCPVKSNELQDYQEQEVMYKEEYKFSKQIIQYSGIYKTVR